MGAQRLGAKRLRQISRDIGEPAIRGWSHGGYWLGFVTADHRHGEWHVRSHEVQWYDADAHYVHYSSCWEDWPEDCRRAQEKHTQHTNVMMENYRQSEEWRVRFSR